MSSAGTGRRPLIVYCELFFIFEKNRCCVLFLTQIENIPARAKVLLVYLKMLISDTY